MKIPYKVNLLALLLIFLVACQTENTSPELKKWKAYDESQWLQENQNNENIRLRYKLIQSKITDKNDLLSDIQPQLAGFSEATYQELTPFIYENSIADIQNHILNKKLTYQLLTQWYLYRIAITETDSIQNLNAIIGINPNAVEEAKKMDKTYSQNNHPIFGMPILLKDNINTKDLKTTAGAAILQHHQPLEDAKIVQNLRSNGAIILGKANLSEWANFLCDGCPNGYSAVGGQTLNPYGARKFDTGGSSSGSASSVAANYAVAAIGSETSGSILSPSSQHSLVGLKPTVKSINQQGIIPISSTLDTPGPITKNAQDNFVVFHAMQNYNEPFRPLQHEVNTKAMRFGAIEAFMQDTLYQKTVMKLEENGHHIELISPEPMSFDGFLELLNGDMKQDLPAYFEAYPIQDQNAKTVADVMDFNQTDSLLHIPYGQARFEGIIAQEMSEPALDSIRQQITKAGIRYFQPLFETYQLDAVLSINNYSAGQAAVAKYPAITLSMGYTEVGEPKGITLIAQPDEEENLLEMALQIEKTLNLRTPPEAYAPRIIKNR